MTNSAAVIAHRDVVQFEQAARGAYRDVNYTPVFRSSALFFAWVDEGIDTHVSFMNYWREKNGNTSVSALLTLRSAEGEKCYREFLPINQSTYQFSVKQLLRSPSRFLGSLEVELFSTEDLKFAYPALEVFYESPKGVSFVHSNQRVFNNVEDQDRTSVMNHWQTGFDVLVDDYFAAHAAGRNEERRGARERADD